jgi:hypothetical protein
MNYSLFKTAREVVKAYAKAKEEHEQDEDWEQAADELEAAVGRLNLAVAEAAGKHAVGPTGETGMLHQDRLAANGWPMRAEEIAVRFGLTPSGARSWLFNNLNAGHLERVARGLYRPTGVQITPATPGPTMRQITLDDAQVVLEYWRSRGKRPKISAQDLHQGANLGRYELEQDLIAARIWKVGQPQLELGAVEE